MPPIINAQGISKKYGVSPLFENLSFTVSEGDRIGVIGPNGCGKSTLLQILEGRILPDSGDVAIRKRARLSYVSQQSEFPAGATVRSVVGNAPAVPEALGRAGFTDFDMPADSLSGGWRKRLAIAHGLVQAPDILLLRSEEHTSELQSPYDLVCRLLLEK